MIHVKNMYHAAADPLASTASAYSARPDINVSIFNVRGSIFKTVLLRSGMQSLQRKIE
jgi:hypothetical protein